MTASRPDLLPFALPNTLGLPKHGLVTDSVLALPSTATMAYPQPLRGDCHIVQHPRATTPQRTAADQAVDTAKDNQWRDYALLCGRYRQIGGQDLGGSDDLPYGIDYHLYCDANYTWVVRTDRTAGYGTVKVEVYLERLFGVFSNADLSMTRRKLAELSWSVTRSDGGPLVLNPVCGNRDLRSPNKDGSKLLINIGSNGANSVDNWNANLSVGDSREGERSFLQHDLITVTLSGNGSIVPGSVGNGISASIAHTKTAADLELVNQYTDNSVPGSITWIEYHYQHEMHFVFAPDGSIENQTYTLGIVGITIINYPDDNEMTTTVDEIRTFAGVTRTSAISFSGTGVDDYLGTLTINDYSTPYCVSFTGGDCGLGELEIDITPSNMRGLGTYLLTDNLLGMYKWFGTPVWEIVGCGGHTTTFEEESLFQHYYTYNPKTGQIATATLQEVCYV